MILYFKTHFIVKDVTGGKVDIDLSIMSMIKIKKQLDLCTVLASDIMGHKSCPLSAGDLDLDATGYIHNYYQSIIIQLT